MLRTSILSSRLHQREPTINGRYERQRKIGSIKDMVNMIVAKRRFGNRISEGFDRRVSNGNPTRVVGQVMAPVTKWKGRSDSYGRAITTRLSGVRRLRRFRASLAFESACIVQLSLRRLVTLFQLLYILHSL